jgi:hypothetical protein
MGLAFKLVTHSALVAHAPPAAPSSRSDQPTPPAPSALAGPTAQEFFDQGLSYLRAGSWSLAVASLTNSYTLRPHTMTAYLLAVAYSRLDKPDETLKAVHNALRGKPPLEEPYTTVAFELVSWAAVDREVERQLPTLTLTLSREGFEHPKDIGLLMSLKKVEEAKLEAFVSDILPAKSIDLIRLRVQIILAECSSAPGSEGVLRQFENGCELPNPPSAPLPEGHPTPVDAPPNP